MEMNWKKHPIGRNKEGMSTLFGRERAVDIKL